ncbi:NlpC/P60 family protein [Algicella marina]|uniref:Peptidase P60 n=1 Tax=Algicella marina TaxID=2683284 RepID=A0A6P1T1V4_9RHOB|nr:NlpC/P60 family protein [Algicella marina]QHQ36718.1 peptidase P60 [Algicella marina]
MATANDPRLTPARGDIAAAHLEGKVTADRFVSGRLLRVAAPVLDMTGKPERSAGLTTQLLMGEAFTAYEKDAETGLAWGQAEDGYVGYVSLAGLEAATEPDMQVAVRGTHIYPEPNIKTRPLEALPMLARIRQVGEAPGFVELESGGWCPAQHLAPSGPLVADFVDAAERFLGAPYLWGGRSTEGVDCSGLVQLALAAAGQQVLRDSDMQAALGAEVQGPLQRGDLICWRGHIGIMASEKDLLHANAHHMAVALEPLAEAEARIAAKEFGQVTGRRRIVG